VNVNEPSDPDAWADNNLCTSQDLGIKWSNGGQISGMRCTQIIESAEPTGHTWYDNYLCVPNTSPLTFQWSSNGPISGLSCIQISEPSDHDTWGDNYLCETGMTMTIGAGHMTPPATTGTTGGSCTTTLFNQSSVLRGGGTTMNMTYEFMNWPGTDQPTQGVLNPMTAAQYMQSSGATQTGTKTYSNGTLLQAEGGWWGGISNPGVPPEVGCHLPSPYGNTCLNYQCDNGVWALRSAITGAMIFGQGGQALPSPGAGGF
jgi:hypothetical protein